MLIKNIHHSLTCSVVSIYEIRIKYMYIKVTQICNHLNEYHEISASESPPPTHTRGQPLLSDHPSNPTTFACQNEWSLVRGSTVIIEYMKSINNFISFINVDFFYI